MVSTSLGLGTNGIVYDQIFQMSPSMLDCILSVDFDFQSFSCWLVTGGFAWLESVVGKN